MMGKRIKLNFGRSGGQPRSVGSIMTGANLRRSSEKKSPPATPAKAARPAPSKAAKRRSR